LIEDYHSRAQSMCLEQIVALAWISYIRLIGMISFAAEDKSTCVVNLGSIWNI